MIVFLQLWKVDRNGMMDALVLGSIVAEMAMAMSGITFWIVLRYVLDQLQIEVPAFFEVLWIVLLATFPVQPAGIPLLAFEIRMEATLTLV